MSVMTAPPRIAQTKAETALAALFAAEKKRLPGGKDFAQRREAAFALFEAAGLPHRRIEEWKYTDLRNLVRTVAPLAGEADASALASLAKNDPLASYDRARLVIANGIYRPDLSDLAGLEGVAVEPLADLLAAAPDRIGKLLPDGLDPVIALNTALVQGGVVVRVARGAKPARPIEIVHVTASISAASVYHRALVDVGGSFPAAIAEELTLEDVPIARIVVPGQRVEGWLDPETKRVDVTKNLRPSTEALSRYAVGDVVLAKVAMVRNGKQASDIANQIPDSARSRGTSGDDRHCRDCSRSAHLLGALALLGHPPQR